MDEFFFFPAKNKKRCASSKSRYLGRKKVPLFNSVKETGFLWIFFYIYLLMDTDSQAFMTICEGNQQPIHKEKF